MTNLTKNTENILKDRVVLEEKCKSISSDLKDILKEHQATTPKISKPVTTYTENVIKKLENMSEDIWTVLKLIYQDLEVKDVWNSDRYNIDNDSKINYWVFYADNYK